MRRAEFEARHDSQYAANSLNTLAEVLLQQQHMDLALPLLQQAWQIQKQVLGDEHPDIARSLANLAAISSAQGEESQAEHYKERATAIQQKILLPYASDLNDSWRENAV